MTRVNSPALNSLPASPETTLEELCINPNDYTFERFRLPAKIHINGDEISSFPILVVRDKNHLNWAELFDREYYEKLREAREQVGTINNSRDMTPLFRASLDILDNEKDNKPEEDSANISDPLPTKPDDNIPF